MADDDPPTLDYSRAPRPSAGGWVGLGLLLVVGLIAGAGTVAAGGLLSVSAADKHNFDGLVVVWFVVAGLLAAGLVWHLARGRGRPSSGRRFFWLGFLLAALVEGTCFAAFKNI